MGKPAQVNDCVASLLAGGHLLIEDVPGVGKTALVHALSRSFGLQFSRVQFTANLMPSDLSGVSIDERQKKALYFTQALCLPRCCWQTRLTVPAQNSKRAA